MKRKTKGDFTNIEMTDRAAIYNRNKDFYDGKYKEFLIDDFETNVRNNIAINMVRQVIDRTISFLFPSVPKLEINEDDEEETSPEETPEEKLVRKTFENNGGVSFMTMVGHNGCLGGHNFLRITPPNPFAEDLGKYPRLINLDPRNVQVYWNAVDMTEVLWYEINWVDGEDQYIEDIVLNKDKMRWDIFIYKRSGVQGSGWRKIATDRWDSVLSPIVDWQHLPNPNQYYGLSEVSSDVERLNDTINRVASDIGLILRFHASPRTVATGVVDDDITETSVDGLWSIASADAKVFNLEMTSDLQSSMTFLQYLNDAILGEARVVIMHGSVKDFQRVTNTGIRAVFLDMLAKNEILRSNYENALKKIVRRILLVMNKQEDVEPTVVWADPLPADQTELVNVLAIEFGNGWVSAETASKKRGYNYTVESKRMEREAEVELERTVALQKALPQPAFGGAKPPQKKGSAPVKQDTNEVKR